MVLTISVGGSADLPSVGLIRVIIDIRSINLKGTNRAISI